MPPHSWTRAATRFCRWPSTLMQKSAFEAALAAVREGAGERAAGGGQQRHHAHHAGDADHPRGVRQGAGDQPARLSSAARCSAFGDGRGRLAASSTWPRWPARTAALPHGAHYAASKGGILTLTKIFARELAASGVTVNASPGPHMGCHSVRAAVPPERLEAHRDDPGEASQQPVVANLVVQLASAEADFATGATGM